MKEARNKLFLIGLTGTIGCGKSFVADILDELGADIIDTDVIARDVVEPGTEGLETIVEWWGDRVLNKDGTLDRDELAKIVFEDEKERVRLNGLLHPLIGKETAQRIEKSASAVTVLVVPLLFESGMDAMVNRSWVVTAPEATLLERICARDNCPEDAARARINSQMNQEEKIKLADVIIDNGGDRKTTRKQVEEVWRKIEKL